jgi:GNAT superfamily N-acetyltransferase
MTIEVRPMRAADAVDVAGIHVRGWQSAYVGIVPDAVLDAMTVPAHTERWRGYLEDRQAEGNHVLALIDRRPAAFVSFGAYRTQQDADPAEDTSGWGEIYALYTDPDLQGRGAGTAVHEAALAALAAARCSLAALWVLRDNTRSREWYTHRNWVADGATSLWLADDEVRLPEVRLRHQLP